jgi:hypothetical protein
MQNRRERHVENPDKRRALKLKYKYGMTLTEYDAMFAEQGGVCAICKRPQIDGRRLAIDHDHRTGAVRGLLCNPCNQMLGAVGDNSLSLVNAIGYLLRAKQ